MGAIKEGKASGKFRCSKFVIGGILIFSLALRYKLFFKSGILNRLTGNKTIDPIKKIFHSDSLKFFFISIK